MRRFKGNITKLTPSTCHEGNFLSASAQVNRVYGWEPEHYFNLTEVWQSEEMPDQLKRVIGAELA